VGITSLESALVTDLRVDEQHSADVRKAAQKIRARADVHITVADVLTELEIAASLAATVPANETYAALAKAIINATGAALIMEQAEADKPIQLETIAAITLIS
jgi:glycerol-3-phosphate dehydrogenase